MAVFLVSEVRMHRDKDGLIRAKHPAAAYGYWKQFATAFENVTVLARLDPRHRDDSGDLVEGPGVRFAPLPYYEGLGGLIRTYPRLVDSLRRQITKEDLVVIRIPEIISLTASKVSSQVNAKTVAFFVSDPVETGAQLSPRGTRTISKFVYSCLTARAMKQAHAGIYVSQSKYQSRYPTASGRPTLGRSNVLLADDWFLSSEELSREYYRQRNAKFTVLSIGTMEHLGKGFDFLIRALSSSEQLREKVKLVLVGEGRYREFLESQALTLGVDASFRGQISSRSELKSIIRTADLYVSGSRHEGLPRATIEAMALAKPVISTNAGAIEEVLQEKDIITIDDSEALLLGIHRYERDLFERETAGKRNLVAALQVADLARPSRLIDFLRKSV